MKPTSSANESSSRLLDISIAEGIEHFARGYCPGFQQAVELIGRRWSGAILLAMLSGAERFSHIRASVPGLSDRLLAERLREYVDAGLAAREVLEEQPVAVRYRLTEKGATLAPVVRELLEWSHRWRLEGEGETAAESTPA